MVSDIHGRKDVLKTLLEVADYKSRDAIIYNGDMVNRFAPQESAFEGFIFDLKGKVRDKITIKH